MARHRRPDGTYLPDLPHFTKILPYLMGSRTDSTIFFEQEFDVTHARAWIRDHNRAPGAPGRKLTYFHIFLGACVRTLALRPRLNRFVSGYRYYQRNQIRLNFVAKKRLHDDGEEININIAFDPEETLATLSEKVNRAVAEAKAGGDNESDRLNELLVKLPRWALRTVIWTLRTLDYHNLLPASFLYSMPFWASIFLTYVGSVGIDAPLHHNYNLGTCGLFVALGKIRRVRHLGPDGNVEERDRVTVTFTYDDRITDGIYCGRAIELLRSFAEHPEHLETAPGLTPEQRAELMVTG